MQAYITSIGLLGPGLPDWLRSRPVLAGEQPYTFEEVPKYAPDILPPTERRRCGAAAKLAIYVADATMKASAHEPNAVASVFATSGGDTDISQKICLALTEAERFVSPTLFHNSVHNAAAGYWCIAAGSHHSSNSLSGHDWSVVAGLQAAMSQVCVDGLPVLLVCYDLPAAEPLFTKRPVLSHFGAALLLEAHADSNTLATLTLAPGGDTPESTMADAGLERLRRQNPAARLLPVLHSLASGQAQEVVLAAPLHKAVTVGITPCQ